MFKNYLVPYLLMHLWTTLSGSDRGLGSEGTVVRKMDKSYLWTIQLWETEIIQLKL